MICDFAETYHIYDWRQLPVRLAATLCYGLGPDSRTRMRQSGLSAPYSTMLTACIVDRLSLLVWMNSEDGHKNRNRPAMILEALTGGKQSNVMTFASGKEFEKARQRIIGGG